MTYLQYSRRLWEHHEKTDNHLHSLYVRWDGASILERDRLRQRRDKLQMRFARSEILYYTAKQIAKQEAGLPYDEVILTGLYD